MDIARKVLQPLDLGTYHEQYAGLVVHVWVNLPRALRDERTSILRALAPLVLNKQKGLGAFTLKWRLKRAQKRMRAWLSQIWSQHADPETVWTPAEIRTLAETDPALYHWLAAMSARMLDEFAAGKKK